MVVVTVLSMVSFLFLDDFGRNKGPMSAFGGGLMVGCVLAAIGCILGYRHEKTAEFGIGGFLAGFLAGFIGFSAMGQNKPVARTSVGSLTHQDFARMKSKRQSVNQFLSSVARRVESAPMYFGGIDEQQLVSHQMLLDDAKKIGIRISDEGVNEFLKQVSRSRLTKDDFKESLREARLGEGELFDILKEELAVRLAIRMIRPPAFVADVPPQFAQFAQNREPLRYMQQTPEQLWDSFQKLNLKQSLQAVEIPVKDFMREVGKPSDTELAEVFSKFKGRPWVNEASPGFYQMPRVRLAYYTADFEKFEQGIQVSDDEIREYYEKNKDRYRAPVAKESTAPKLPDGVGESPEPANSAPEAPSVPEEAEKKEATPPEDGESKKDSKPKTKDAPQENGTPPENPKSEPKCGQDDEKAKDVTDEVPAAKPETKSNENPSEKKDPVEQPALPPADAPLTPKLTTSPEALPEAKFRELDGDLKLEIQGILLRERTFAKISVALDKAYEFMVPLGLDYETAEGDTQKKEAAKAISNKMKEYAVLNQLEYVETPVLEYEALSKEPIGMAVEGQGRSTVANEVMMRGDKNESRMPLYVPRRADLRTRKGSFAYWKIEDTPPRIPELTEELVREKVERAWKFDQARLLAEKRAKKLSEKAKAEDSNLTAALAGESITGRSTDAQLSVIETPEFTWLSTPRSVPGAQQEPMTTDIPLIKSAGNDFMKIVFEDLKEGEIGVAPNFDKSAYYIVKVVGRDLAKDDGGVAKQERFKRFLGASSEFQGFFPIIKSPYESIAELPQRAIDQAWSQSFEKRHQVEWEEEAPQPRRRR